MQKIKKKLSLFVLAALILQLFSPVTSVFAAITLPAPDNFRYVLDGIDNVILRWNDVNGATAYRIYEIKDQDKVLIIQTTSPNRYLAGVKEGSHTYGVTTVNSTGESQLSSLLTVEIKYPTMQPPNGLSYSVVNGNDVSLTWSATEFATSYKVYEVINGQRQLIATPTKASQYFSTVSEGEHLYEVTSYNTQFGESTSSSIKVNVIYPETSAPTGIKSYINNVNNVILRWDPVQNVTSYNIYEIVDGNRKLVNSTTNTNQYVINVSAGFHVYEVTALSKFGESKTGSQTKIEIVYPTLLPPGQIYSYVYNGNDLLLMWSAADYADTYKLYRIVNGQKELIETTSNRSHYFTNLPEGDYTFEIVSVSERFGESTPGTYNTTIAFPVIQTPIAYAVKDTENSASIRWSSDPYATEYEVYKLIDGVPNLIKTTTNNSYYATDLEQGKHEYAIIAKSERFGSSPYSNIVVVDVAPVLRAPQDAKPEVKDKSVNLSWDTVPDADKYNIYEVVDGERVLVGTTTDPNYTLNKPEEQGTHEYQIVPVTKDGTESIDYATVTVDINQPSDVTPPVTSADTKLEWSKDDVSVTLSATDDLSGVKSTYYSINHSEFAEGTQLTLNQAGVNTVSFYSVDNAGNVEEVKTIDVKIDKQAPETVINTSAYWYNNDVNVNLTATDDLSGVKATYYSVDGSEFAEGTNFALEKEGVHTVSFYSEDNVGNVEEKRTVEVKMDKQAPKTTADIKDNSLVELTATDDLSGVHATYYSINGSDFTEGTSFVVDQQGVNTVTFYSIDNAGNMEAKQTIEVIVDKTAPVTVSNLEDKWYRDSLNVKLTATDDLSGVKATYYSIDGADFNKGTSLTIEKEGKHEVTFYSVDNAGNIEERHKVAVNLDKTAPTTVSNLEDKWNTNTVDVKLTATDDLSGVKATYYSIDGADFNEGTSLTVEKEGKHEVTFYSVDNAGNIEEKHTVAVNVDKTAPTTVSNLEEKWQTNTVNVELTATDDLSGVKTTYYSIDGADFNEGTSFTVEKEGKHEVTFYSVDNAGNIEDKHTVVVNVDKAAPTTVSNVEDKWYTDTVNVELTATDDLSGVKATYYSIDGAAFIEGTLLKVEKEGKHTLTFYSTDNAGNIEAKHTVEVNVDKTVPTIKADLPTEFALGSSVELKYEAADNLSGIKESYVEVNGVKNTTGKITFDKPGDYTIKITAIDNAGLKTVVEKTVSTYIQATIEVTPKVINCNNGEFTVRATLPKGYSFANVDLSTVTINNVHALSDSKGLQNQAKNGQFKFERDDFIWDESKELLVFRAKVGGVLVVGSTTVDVINNQKKSCDNNWLFGFLF
ncbi:hypothetical protein ABES02_00380 [Neobacillus pocheonensis]|uniref:OmpL47-type beta-barrel domain-containing protein n=1 Tax=Neobacillus pocheonensis TaxID=363869 RepID=UPI003D2AB4BC